MAFMTRDNAKDYINAQEPTFLRRAHKVGYICPVCGQGQNKGNGLTRATGRPNLWHCVEEDKERSVLGLFAHANEIPDDTEHFPEILERAAEYYGISLEDSGNQKPPKIERKPNTQSAPEQDFTAFYKEAAAHLQETDYYDRRGLSLGLCAYYSIGFIPEWRHPKKPKDPLSPRLIIPVTPYSYVARDTRDNLTEQQDEDKKMKVKGRAEVSWTFNREALQNTEKPVYVVEGEIDALSIIETGGEAVAMGSTEYRKRFIAELREKRPAQPLIIALDNDNAGQKATEDLERALSELNIPHIKFNPAGSYKDANELLVADRDTLYNNVKEGEKLVRAAEEKAQQERREEYLKNSAAAHLQDFIDGIAASVDTPSIPTGFKALDAVLDGGLFEGLYICGAISSLGKTTLITQIGDQIAQSGQDVIVFSLEMARTELMAKSISRLTLQEVLETGGRVENAKTSRGITTGSRYAQYFEEEKKLIQTAIKRYAGYAGHIFIHEGVGDIGVKQIREIIQEHISITGNSPVAILDYLQILSPYNDRATDKQNTDKNVLELKRISRDFKIPILAISSFNRENYKNAVTMEAFKESGAVEYSSDVLIGLQLAGIGGADFDANKEKKRNPREIELVILKNRNGSTGNKVGFQYYPLFNYFRETKEITEE